MPPPGMVADRARAEAVIRPRRDLDAGASSDRGLIRGCREGDVAAWQGLLDRYERLVFSIPRRYGLSREDAADITQLTFTILVQSIDTLPEDSNLGAWLATVARRHTWRLVDRNRRADTGELGDIGGGKALLVPDDIEDVERWELAEWLERGLSLVGGKCRDLLQALYLDERQPSYAEVSERLGVPLGSIGPTRIRCLKRLRQVLGE